MLPSPLAVDLLYCQISGAPLHGLYPAAKQSVLKTACSKVEGMWSA